MIIRTDDGLVETEECWKTDTEDLFPGAKQDTNFFVTFYTGKRRKSKFFETIEERAKFIKQHNIMIGEKQ